MIDNATYAQIDRRIEENLDRYIDILARLCAQPSVSAQHLGIEPCAELVATILREEGFRGGDRALGRATRWLWAVARAQPEDAAYVPAAYSRPSRWSVGVAAL